MVLKFKGSSARPKKMQVRPTRIFSKGEDTCPDCHGSGKISGHDCPKCHGTGHLPHH